MKMSLRSKVVIYALLVMVAIYFLSPFVYMLFSTFKTSAEAIAYPPSLFPKEWQWGNYAKAWDAQPFGKYLLNSVIVTVLNTLGTVLSCSLVAYGFARYNFKGKNILFMILLSTMMIPWDVTMIPQYMEFKAFGWINTLLPLIVPSFFGSAYYIFLMRQFLLGVPKEYEEAARIDGCNDLQIWWKVYMPIMRPCLILVGVLNMITVWNDYLGPLIFLQDRSKYTLALGLASFKGVHQTQIIPMLCITVVMIIPEVHRRRYLRFHQVIPWAGQGWLRPIARSPLWSPERFPGRMMPHARDASGHRSRPGPSAPKPHQGV